MDFLAGNRIRGTTAEKATLVPSVTGTGGWKEVGRTTLGSDSATIDVSWTPDKRYYMILMDYTQTSDFAGLHRLGNSTIDGGNNYHNRQSSNGATDATSQATYVRLDNGWQSGDRKFVVEYIADLTNKEKLIMNHMVRSVGTGAGTVTQRSEVVSKWVPSTASDTIGKFQMMNGGEYASGSEVVVLGWDEDDTHGSNFWEELADVTLGSSSTTWDTGAFAAKKYLWIQGVIEITGNTTWVRANGDTGNNYAGRGSLNGDTDSTRTSESGMRDTLETASGKHFINMFVINNSANEKLFLSHVAHQGTAGAANSPNRREGAKKWTNTSSQVTSLQFTSDNSNGIVSGSTLKVWGSN